MSETDTELIHNVSAGAIAGTSPSEEPLTVLAAPSVGKEFNTVKAFLTPTGCWKVEDLLFEFDSSIVRPIAREELPALFRLMEDNSKKDLDSGETRPPVLSIFGHADPAGKEEYNKALSGRRAAAIYGMLTRRVEIWEGLFQNKGGFTPVAAGDTWGAGALGTMRTALGMEAPQNGGKLPEETNGAARKALFLAYMDFCCVDPTGNPFRVDPDNGFLARNTSKDGIGDLQGCGEFNPVLLFSRDDKIELDRKENQPDRNKRNEPNRRVMVLLFQPGAKIDPNKWPCPAINQGVGKCKARFFSDANERLRNDADERRFEKTKDTFACRFYDRLAFRSPCESVDRSTLSHISLLLRSNSGSAPVAGKKYRIRISEKRVLEGTTDEEGLVSHALVPPGEYPLKIEGLDGELIIPTLPSHLTRRATRVPGFFLENQHFVEVQVVDGKGKALPGTTVVLLLPDRTKKPATTDSTGVVRFEGLTPRDAQIMFDEPDVYPDEEPVDFSPEPPPDTVTGSGEESSSSPAARQGGMEEIDVEEQYVDVHNLKDTDTSEEA